MKTSRKRPNERERWHQQWCVCPSAHLMLYSSNRVACFRVMKQELEKGESQDVSELLGKISETEIQIDRTRFKYLLFWKHSGLAPVGKHDFSLSKSHFEISWLVLMVWIFLMVAPQQFLFTVPLTAELLFLTFITVTTRTQQQLLYNVKNYSLRDENGKPITLLWTCWLNSLKSQLTEVLCYSVFLLFGLSPALSSARTFKMRRKARFYPHTLHCPLSFPTDTHRTCVILLITVSKSFSFRCLYFFPFLKLLCF